MLSAMQRHIPAGTIRVVRPQGGLYLWCRLSGGVSSRALLDHALTHGVAFVPGHAFYADPAGESELRLCFSSVLPSSIDEAIRKLAVSLQQTGRAVRRDLIATA